MATGREYGLYGMWTLKDLDNSNFQVEDVTLSQNHGTRVGNVTKANAFTVVPGKCG